MMPRPQLFEAKRRWTVPKGLDRSRPREVRLTATGRFLVGLSAIFIVAGVVVGVLMVVVAEQQQAERRGLVERGIDTEAAVTAVTTSRGEETRYVVSFQFFAGDRLVVRQQRVGRATAGRLREGSRIPVRYDPANPNIFEALNRSRSQLPGWLAYIVGLALVGTGALVRLPITKERRLLEEGRPAPGVVVNCKRTHTKHNGSQVVVEYEFLLLNGAAHAGKAGGRKLEQGQAVSVLYEPDNPRRSALYPFSLVRLA